MPTFTLTDNDDVFAFGPGNDVPDLTDETIFGQGGDGRDIEGEVFVQLVVGRALHGAAGDQVFDVLLQGLARRLQVGGAGRRQVFALQPAGHGFENGAGVFVHRPFFAAVERQFVLGGVGMTSVAVPVVVVVGTAGQEEGGGEQGEDRGGCGFHLGAFLRWGAGGRRALSLIEKRTQGLCCP